MKLSIITVNYNNRTGLERTIKSVADQTQTDIEYLVIDGGSTDGSIELIKSFGPKITEWISENDTGIYEAMNKGIMRSSGEYLLFLNSGDYLYSNETIEQVQNNLGSEDILYGNIIFEKNGNDRTPGYMPFFKNYIPVQDVFGSQIILD